MYRQVFTLPEANVNKAKSRKGIICMINIDIDEKERIPEAIMALWDDHYVPEDELFNYSVIRDTEGAKDRMLKILRERDTASIYDMIRNEQGSKLWDSFCTCAETYAGLDNNRDYCEMCRKLGMAIIHMRPKPEGYSPYADEYDASDYYYPPESDWPPACLGDLECPEENWPDD